MRACYALCLSAVATFFVIPNPLGAAGEAIADSVSSESFVMHGSLFVTDSEGTPIGGFVGTFSLDGGDTQYTVLPHGEKARRLVRDSMLVAAPVRASTCNLSELGPLDGSILLFGALASEHGGSSTSETGVFDISVSGARLVDASDGYSAVTVLVDLESECSNSAEVADWISRAARSSPVVTVPPPDTSPINFPESFSGYDPVFADDGWVVCYPMRVDSGCSGASSGYDPVIADDGWVVYYPLRVDSGYPDALSGYDPIIADDGGVVYYPLRADSGSSGASSGSDPVIADDGCVIYYPCRAVSDSTRSFSILDSSGGIPRISFDLSELDSVFCCDFDLGASLASFNESFVVTTHSDSP